MTELPFDINRKKVFQYRCEETDAPAQARASRTATLITALQASLKHLHNENKAASNRSRLDYLLNQIETQGVEHESAAIEFVQWVGDELEDLDPKATPDEHEKFCSSLPPSLPPVNDFTQVCARIAQRNDVDSASGIYSGFEGSLSRYPTGLKAEISRRTDSDYLRFHGHELFVIFVSSLLKWSRFEILATVLPRRLLAVTISSGKTNEPFDEVSAFCAMFDHRNRVLNLRRRSLRADMLNERHGAKFEEFMCADYCLAMRAAFAEQDREWHAWSLVFFDWVTPDYLLKAQSAAYATRLATALGLKDVAAFRAIYGEKRNKLTARLSDYAPRHTQLA